MFAQGPRVAADLRDGGGGVAVPRGVLDIRQCLLNT